MSFLTQMGAASIDFEEVETLELSVRDTTSEGFYGLLLARWAAFAVSQDVMMSHLIPLEMSI